VRSANEEEERECGPEELGQIDQKVLVAWVNAVLGKVGRVGVVDEIVERSDDRTVEDFLKGKLAGRVRRRVYTDGKEGGEERKEGEEYKGKGSIDVSNERREDSGKLTCA
jgi:hypothetical protein